MNIKERIQQDIAKLTVSEEIEMLNKYKKTHNPDDLESLRWALESV